MAHKIRKQVWDKFSGQLLGTARRIGPHPTFAETRGSDAKATTGEAND